MKLGVFLSSRTDIDPAFKDAAVAVGRMIGRLGATLVYGGSTQGMMEVLAIATKEAGGKTYGVVPDALVERGLVSEYIDVTFRCVDLTDRKAIMMRESDVMIALPGGIGTLDETVTLLAMNTFLRNTKPMILLNVNGCWDTFIAMLADMYERRLLRKPPCEMLTVVNSVEELEEHLRNIA